MSPEPLRIAHRGMPRLARENTVASFALALERGAQGLELDVHCTRDGVVVVHHDHQLADGSAIDQLTLGQLRERDGNPRQPIPTLGDVCSLVGQRATLFVELKGANTGESVCEVLATHAGPAAIHSFDHAMIRRLADAGCRWPLGILVEDALPDPAEALRAAGATDLWPHWPLADAALVAAVHEAGGRVIPWTVNDPGSARVLWDMGVDGICTDDVGLLASLSRPGARP